MPLYPPADPRAPKFWMYEQSGILAPVIGAYLTGKEMNAEQFGIMRAYLKQWIDSPVWDENPHAGAAGRSQISGLRDGIASLTNRAQIESWLARAVSCGIDPL